MQKASRGMSSESRGKSLDIVDRAKFRVCVLDDNQSRLEFLRESDHRREIDSAIGKKVGIDDLGTAVAFETREEVENAGMFSTATDDGEAVRVLVAAEAFRQEGAEDGARVGFGAARGKHTTVS